MTIIKIFEIKMPPPPHVIPHAATHTTTCITIATPITKKLFLFPFDPC
jgi:hypothetical protein